MNLAMAFDNSFVVMNEEEMHDVNGGWRPKISTLTKNIKGALGVTFSSAAFRDAARQVGLYGVLFNGASMCWKLAVLKLGSIAAVSRALAVAVAVGAYTLSAFRMFY